MEINLSAIQRFFHKNWPEAIFATAALAFSFWLMTSTFDSDPKSGTITIAAKAWSDFAANIPLIRSFSWGENFPPEYPLFPGEPIRYHFLFYLLVGLLEKSGLSLGWALNLPSTLGFFALLLMIYFLAKLIFQNREVAILAVVFFLLNGSFGFAYFLQKHPLAFPQTILDILNTRDFSAFGPYDKGIVTGFWNLNIFTNQRHFASGLFLTLLPLYLFLRAQQKKQFLSIKTSLILGILVGLLPFWHATGFIMSLVILGGIFLIFPQKRRVFLILLVAGILALPQIFYLNHAGGTASFQLHPGYLLATNLSIFNFFRFWILNLGLSFFLIPLGIMFSPPKTRRAFWLVVPIFAIGNLFQFSPDIAINHKFFNLFLIISNMFVAYFLIILWRRNIIAKTLVLSTVLFLTLSGTIDFFAIKNDRFYTLLDAPKNPDIAWIKNNTPLSAVFLNSTYLYHPASLAGRKIFLGWPYFPWSAGYDTEKRSRILKQIYQAPSISYLCSSLKDNKIDYVATTKDFSGSSDYPIISPLFEQLPRLYFNQETSFTIYSRREICKT